MEKVFQGGKWFVIFCAVFILVWFAQQTVSSMRLEDEAKEIGRGIFTWFWPAENCQSEAEITEASIISKNDNDAVIKIKGKQVLLRYNPASSLDRKNARQQTMDCSALLTLYRQNNRWILGRLEL